MKRGANQLSEIDSTNHKKQKTTKFVAVTLQDVNTGNFTDYHNSLVQDNVTSIMLSGKGEIDVVQLGLMLKDTQVDTLFLMGIKIGDDGAASLIKALKDTQVHTLNLFANNIGDIGAAQMGTDLKDTQVHSLDLQCNQISNDGAAQLIANLKDTKVHTLTLINNKISNDGATKLAAFIPDTLLFNIKLGFKNTELEAALKKNRWVKQLSPYYIASLQHLPENEKNQYYRLPEASAKTAALTFAGGIFMALGQKGFSGEGLQNKILSYLPGVNSTLAHQYQLATAQAATKKHASSVEGMDVESSNVNSNRLLG